MIAAKIFASIVGATGLEPVGFHIPGAYRKQATPSAIIAVVQETILLGIAFVLAVFP
jgi:hypothetical protein